METIVKLLFFLGMGAFGLYHAVEGDNSGAKFIGMFFVVVAVVCIVIELGMVAKGDTSYWPPSDSDE